MEYEKLETERKKPIDHRSLIYYFLVGFSQIYIYLASTENVKTTTSSSTPEPYQILHATASQDVPLCPLVVCI